MVIEAVQRQASSVWRILLPIPSTDPSTRPLLVEIWKGG